MSSTQQELQQEPPKTSELPAVEESIPTPSSFTAVNGRNSPPKVVNGVASPTTAAVPETAQPAASPKEREAPKLEGIQVPPTQSASASLTTSPSIVESITNTARNETPNSPQTAANSPPRKRSFPEEFESTARESKRPALPETQGSPKMELQSVSSPQTLVQEQPIARKIEQQQQQQRQRPLSSEYDPLAQPNQNYYSRQDDSDQQMSDHMRRDSEDPNDQRARFASPDPDDEPQRHQFGEYSRSGVQVDQDRKRRKRVFSNRTKTGCMTCRKRKKKFDELHPECNNCLRGGFVCEGYTVRNAWGHNTPKQPSIKTPIALQSKPVPYGSPSQFHPASRHTEVNEYGATSKPDLPRIEDHHREMSRHSPANEPRSAHPTAYSGPPPHAYTQGQSSQHQSPHQRYERPIQSAHENVHEPPEASNPYPVSSAHGSAVPLHPSHPQHSHHSSMGRPASIHGPPVIAPSQEHASSANLSRRPSQRPEMSERDKMLRGEYYLPYTPALIADREQCAAAVWRFNNSTNPTMGIPPEDRMRFFRQILELRPSHDASVPPPGPHEPPPDPQYVPNGSVGPGVVVEAPFHCDYGYNITIGQDVVIGPDCRISDTCAVTIGNNVVFSPGVKLVCATYAIDPRERRKGKGRALGRNIVIEDDAWIGSNVTVLPGVRVGRCSTVGAGSLLHKDVPPYTVVAGNPPKVVRGIYDDGRN